MRNRVKLAILAHAFAIIACANGQEAPGLRADAQRAMRKAAEFFHAHASSHGGYVYYWNAGDLNERWGEGKAGKDTIFVQPPGTPTVGSAYLTAYAATGERFYLDAARDAARALMRGQLQSGGWTQVIHFAPTQRMGKYRLGNGGAWNVSSLDDDQTQAALKFLIRADQALGFQDKELGEAVFVGLHALLKAQFPNGGFPQVWTGPVEKKPVLQAAYPAYDWKTVGRVKTYWDYYTLNDNLAGSVADTLIQAHQVYKLTAYRDALVKLGDFLVLAQMPDPQPGWCQQYSYEMIPIWARKFEPPAITGWESQDVMETLIKVAEFTGDEKYLKPIPRALAYFRKSLLPDGRVARYYELKTNKPLYMDARYQLTHDDTAAPSHYGWKQPARFDAIEAEYRRVLDKRPAAQRNRDLSAAVRRIVADLDAQGRWVTTYAGERLVGQPKFAQSFRYLSADVFSRNMETLSAFVEATR